MSDTASDPWRRPRGTSSRSSSTRSTPTRARRARSRSACARRSRSGSTAGTRTAPSGSSGSSGTRPRAPRSPGCCTPRPTTSPSRPRSRRAVSALVSALDLSGERNRIVISEYEFPTVGQIAHAQELRGAEVVHVRPEADGRIPLERFADAIDERTALVCCTAVSFRSGHRHDVSAIAELAHASGALVLADSYQAIGALELDVRTLGADVVTGGTVKYLLGSAGLGFMWMRELAALERCCRLRPAGSRTRTSSRCPSPTTRRTRAARRFDSGTPPVPSLYPGVAGMGLIAEVGVPAIEAHVRRLVDRLLAGLDELGATVATGRGEREYGPLICVVSTDPNALVAALAAERIVTSTRDSNLRISLHLYNVEEDVDRILAALPRTARSSPRAARRRRARRSRSAAGRGAAVRASATRGSSGRSRDSARRASSGADAHERAGRLPATIPKQSTQ